MGFQHMSKERQLQIQRAGNKAQRAKGKAPSYDSDTAKKAAGKRWDNAKRDVIEPDVGFYGDKY